MARLVSWSPEAFRPQNPGPNLTGDAQGNKVAGFNDTTREIVHIIWVDAGALTANFTVAIKWRADTATTGNVRWQVSIEAITPGDSTDTDAGSSFAAAQEVTDAAPATAGFMVEAEVTFTAAQADNIAEGDQVRIEVSRDPADVADTMVGDAEIMGVSYRDAA